MHNFPYKSLIISGEIESESTKTQTLIRRDHKKLSLLTKVTGSKGLVDSLRERPLPGSAITRSSGNFSIPVKTSL